MKRLLALLVLLFTASCVIAPSPTVSLAELPSAYVTPSPPLDPEVSPFLVNVMLNGQGPFRMLVDTGSSQSAIFPSAASQLGVTFGNETMVMVRGLNSMAERPLIRGIDLELGPFLYEDIPLVGLPDRIPPRFQGIIGADILTDFVMVFNAESRGLIFVPREDVPPDTFRFWRASPLIPPPSGNESFGLAFITTEVNNTEITALIDSGTVLSVANWQTALFSPRVRVLRNQLRRQWELEGANGVFRPRAAVTLERIEVGAFQWTQPRLLMSDFTTLDVLGADTEPFIIVGVDLLSQQSFAFDVQGRQMWFEPSNDHRRGDNLTNVYLPVGVQ
ncbi:MAG: retropepsin-like aspartic protease [Pseudomonadota bacterium]